MSQGQGGGFRPSQYGAASNGLPPQMSRATGGGYPPQFGGPATGGGTPFQPMPATGGGYPPQQFGRPGIGGGLPPQQFQRPAYNPQFDYASAYGSPAYPQTGGGLPMQRNYAQSMSGEDYQPGIGNLTPPQPLRPFEPTGTPANPRMAYGGPTPSGFGQRAPQQPGMPYDPYSGGM